MVLDIFSIHCSLIHFTTAVSWFILHLWQNVNSVNVTVLCLNTATAHLLNLIIDIFPLMWYFNDACVVDGDPHFMIELPERDEALCFNINDKPGTIFSLVRDPKSGQPSPTCSIRANIFLMGNMTTSQKRVFQVSLWMAKLSARRNLFPMVTSTPTLVVLVSATRSWGWNWRWALRTSQSPMTESMSSCSGLMQLLSKTPSELHFRIVV